MKRLRENLLSTFFLILYLQNSQLASAQDYEVADIDCGISQGKELLTARLRKPDGFRGFPIFADDRGNTNVMQGLNPVAQDITKESSCQIYADPTDQSGRIYAMRITDFNKCGVLKRNGFVHVRIWFPQLQGVVMMSDQEVIILCKPPSPIITQSKAAGFAGSFPSGARISGIVEETPGRKLEYEVALFRETLNSNGGRSVPNGEGGSTTFVTGIDSHELSVSGVDQAVPIGTRLQLRAKINSDSAWQFAKLMEVSVSPDPKDALAEGSVSLVKDGCRNPELSSIIPKQPYRYKEKTNEIVLDFEAFLLSNMGERNTLWLHTQIKACMEAEDCQPEFCMDVYQPSSYGRRKREVSSSSFKMSSNSSSAEYSSPLSKHWKTFDNGNQVPHEDDEIEISDNPNKDFNEHSEKEPLNIPPPVYSQQQQQSKQKRMKEIKKNKNDSEKETSFGDNIGFSVIMPAEYYRTSDGMGSGFECRGWMTVTLFSLLAALIGGIISCGMSYRIRKSYAEKQRQFFNPEKLPLPYR